MDCKMIYAPVEQNSIAKFICGVKKGRELFFGDFNVKVSFDYRTNKIW